MSDIGIRALLLMIF